jgi:hypothetical protein
MHLNTDVSQVIDRTALIENMLNQVIQSYVSPRKDRFDFFSNVLLDSSTIPFGNKVKVVRAIARRLDLKMDEKPIHKVMEYRNAFAHHAVNSHPTLAVRKTPDDDQQYFMLHIFRMSGKIDKEKRNEALLKFNKNYEAVKESLMGLLDVVNSDVAP